MRPFSSGPQQFYGGNGGHVEAQGLKNGSDKGIACFELGKQNMLQSVTDCRVLLSSGECSVHVD